MIGMVLAFGRQLSISAGLLKEGWHFEAVIVAFLLLPQPPAADGDDDGDWWPVLFVCLSWQRRLCGDGQLTVFAVPYAG